MTKRIYTQEQKERRKAYYQEYYVQKSDKLKASRKEYYLKNPEKVKAYRKEWRLKNLEKTSAQHKRWCLQNPEKLKAYRKEYRLKKKASEIPCQNIKSNKKPYGFWKIPENIENWLLSCPSVKFEGKFPVLREMPSQLQFMIAKNPSIRNDFIEKHNIDKAHNQKCHGYWRNNMNCQTTLMEIKNKIGHCPSYTELVLLGFATLSERARFLDAEFLKEIGFIDRATIFCSKDGNPVRSMNELYFDNFLSYNNLPHESEGLIPNQTNKYRYDFKIMTPNPIFVEIWGYSDRVSTKRNNDYTLKRRKKEKLYESLGLSLIGIEAETFLLSFPKMYDSFCKIIKDKIFDFVAKPIDLDYFLYGREYSIDNLLDKLRSVIDSNNGYWPSAKQLQKNSVASQVQKHGGIDVFKQILGVDSKPRQKKYTLENIKEDIISYYGYYVPSANQLLQDGNDHIQNFIVRNGGVENISSLLQIPTRRQFNVLQKKA